MNNASNKDTLIVPGINWTWCWYSTEEVANQVKEAIEYVSPGTTVSDVVKSFNDGCPTYNGEPMYGFRFHK